MFSEEDNIDLVPFPQFFSKSVGETEEEGGLAWPEEVGKKGLSSTL